jgi:exopolyphosphatase/guanosine-5'-triphosphate,3'-diphosphate pyrophosphatase
MGATGTVAAIDCGTNSTRLLVVDGSGRSLVREMRITRLGQGVDATHALAPDAVARTLDVLREFRKLMDEEEVSRSRLVATSAVRDATNGNSFLEQAGAVVGTRAELLPGLEEGRLAFSGATADLAPRPGRTVVVDIGGGSTELVVDHERTLEAVSMDIGCVRLTERCLRHDPPSAHEVADAVAVIDQQLERASSAISALVAQPPGSRLIGLAGTVSTLSALEQGLAVYDRDRIHHSVLSVDAVRRWCEIFARESSSARARRPGMLDGRQDVIFGGALVLRRVMEHCGFGECLVSEADILDGLAQSLREI